MATSVQSFPPLRLPAHQPSNSLAASPLKLATARVRQIRLSLSMAIAKDERLVRCQASHVAPPVRSLHAAKVSYRQVAMEMERSTTAAILRSRTPVSCVHVHTARSSGSWWSWLWICALKELISSTAPSDTNNLHRLRMRAQKKGEYENTQTLERPRCDESAVERHLYPRKLVRHALL